MIAGVGTVVGWGVAMDAFGLEFLIDPGLFDDMALDEDVVCDVEDSDSSSDVLVSSVFFF